MAEKENIFAGLRIRASGDNLTSRLETLLSDKIRSGLIPLGAKFPTQDEMTVEYGVSQSVVREAISRLQAAGIVETYHGKGTFVINTPAVRGFRVDPATRLKLDQQLESLEFRSPLQVDAAGLAAQLRSEAHLISIMDALNMIRLQEHWPERRRWLDFQFHLEVAKACGNQFIISMLSYLGTESCCYVERIEQPCQGEKTGQLQSSQCFELEAIYQAILARDVAGARAATYMYFTGERLRLRRLYEAEES